MDIPVASYVANTICVDSEPIYLERRSSAEAPVGNFVSSEDSYHREVEYKMKQKFEEYLYDYYTKRGIKNIDEYTRNRIWSHIQKTKQIV